MSEPERESAMSGEIQRVAFVTGGSRGIGLACARALAAAGHLTAVGSRSKPDEIDPNLHWVECDVTDPASVDAAFTAVEQQLGGVQILVNAAGVTRDTLLLRMSDDDFTSVLDANLTGAFRTAKRAVRSMMIAPCSCVSRMERAVYCSPARSKWAK